MSSQPTPITNIDSKSIPVINNQTVKNPDGSYSAKSAFITSGVKWGSSGNGTSGGNVTWSFAKFNFNDRLSFDQLLYSSLEDDVRNAFKTWQDVADITFTEVEDSSNTDIRIGMNAIDGVNNTLGTAHYTYSGNIFSFADIELDTSEDWSGSLPYLTLVHEIGHAIGLDHENRVPAIMNSTIDTNLTGLTNDDKEGIIAIYGPAANTGPADIPASIDTTAKFDIAESYQGIIHSETDIDWVKVTLFSGVDYVIELKGQDSNSGTLADPFIAGIYDVNGSFLGSQTTNDDGGVGLDSKLSFRADRTGEYFIAADAFSTPTASDSYTLSISYQTPATNFKASDSKNILQGSQGIDYAQYSILSSQANITKAAGQDNYFLSRNGTRDELTNIERLQFLDKNIALDIDDNAGQAYRLYKAAFDREPDSAGLGYWINDLDNGRSLVEISQGFIDSAEFRLSTGINPSQENFITLLYTNVLNRTPDQAGFDYWINDLNQGTSYAGALASFSESIENKANVIGLIENGISYDQWVA